MTSQKAQHPIYDVCVVGAGMMGSSAARHASLMTSPTGQRLTVCVIGPEEPKVRSRDRTVYSSHYDEGRITRRTAWDYVWSTLAVRSIARYRTLEQESGIRFYEEVGCLTMCDDVGPGAGMLEKRLASYSRNGLSGLQQLNCAEVNAKFPYLGGPSCKAVFEATDAGYINPRRLIEAELKVAQAAGCHLIRDVVSDVTELAGGRGMLKVRTEGGLEVRAHKVLLAPGAFTYSNRLLPPWVDLDLRPSTEVVMFAELSEADAKRLREMPTMLVQSRGLADPNKTTNDEQYDSFAIPPITYPDGKVYLKIGHGSLASRLLAPEEIAGWYLTPVPTHIQNKLQRIFSVLFPDIRPLSVSFDKCVTTHTPTRRPYIDLLTPTLGVAVGGNAYAAKSCDEIGRLAASLLVSGTWTDQQLPRDAFKAVQLAPLPTHLIAKL